jgi:uncharacterized protein with ParB-like and HNH nuclease domain
MNRAHKDLKELSIGNLFASKEMYVIPIYQRNYSWGKPQIEQLVEDIWDYAFAKADSETSYFIGNLIVFNREQRSSEVIFETIDGQQRLTTLTIMSLVRKKSVNNLFFYLIVESNLKKPWSIFIGQKIKKRFTVAQQR